jgi:hypothetical protein
MEWRDARVAAALGMIRRYRAGQTSEDIWQLLAASVDSDIWRAAVIRYEALGGCNG